jgi:2-dehydropantoate 2-reductase
MGRFVVFGAGAVGGAIGGRLHASGHDVLLVARGAHGQAIAERGLRLETPEGVEQLAVPAVVSLRPSSLSEDDVVLLATKSQDTRAALDQLVAAASAEVPVVCVQNGIANEVVALRRFERVYGMLVIVPGTHLEPGVVVLSASGVRGVLDIGRFPSGQDEVSGRVAGALHAAGFCSAEREQIMPWKRTKLLFNLANALQALVGLGADVADLAAAAREEGRKALVAAGLEFIDEAIFRERISVVETVPGGPAGRAGGSSWQSLVRGLPTIEADYLNGEIVLLGRLHGVTTPVNALLQRLAREQARAGAKPGSVSPDEIRARLGWR